MSAVAVLRHGRAALGFLTVVPGGGAPEPPARVAFPLVGAMLGAAVGLVHWGAGAWWSPLVAAVLAVTADAVLTGVLHLDGLADSADGLLAPMDGERRLAVMRTPDAGAFAVAAVALVLALRTAALAGAASEAGTVAALAALWAASRALMAVVPAVVPYARASGLAAAFLGDRRAERSAALGAGAVAVVAVAVLAPLAGDAGRVLLAVLAVLAAGAAVVAFARGRLGGFTGDVLGAAGLVGETAGLLVLAARP